MISSFVVSLVLYPSLPPSLAGVGVCRAVCRKWLLRNGGKWPQEWKRQFVYIQQPKAKQRTRSPKKLELLSNCYFSLIDMGLPLIEGRNFWQSSERKHWRLCFEIELGPLPPMSPFLFSFLPPHRGEEPWIMTRGDEVSRESQSSLLSPWIASAVPWLHGR